MIYVILSAGFKKDSDTEFIKLLKIGYTGDDRKDGRYYQYISHNPTVKILYEIPDGTEEIEELLHSYFSKYRYLEYGREWFEWNEKIIEFFEIHKTIDDLLKVIDLDLKEGDSRYRFNGFNKYVYEIIDLGLNYKMSLDSSYSIDQAIKDREMYFNKIDSSRLILKSGVYKTILKYLGIIEEDFNKYVNRDIPENIKNFIDNFNTLPGFYDKMKAICESPFSETERLVILEQVPLLYKNMYLQFGSVRLKAKSYNITNLRKELEPPTEKEDITKTSGYINSKSEILNHFSIGSRYTLTYIKETLGNIYQSVGYKKTPKACDLEIYFNLKKVQIITSGKKIHGYEILSKKEL